MLTNCFRLGLLLVVFFPQEFRFLCAAAEGWNTTANIGKSGSRRVSSLRQAATGTRIRERYKARCSNVLQGKSEVGFSQAFQDWILYQNYFHNLHNGFYLDIGTNHPIQISNTAFFDICLGWEGVCFEPQKRYHQIIKELRSCTLVPSCVLGVNASVSFSGSGGGLRVHPNVGGAKLECQGIEEILSTIGLMGKKVDLMSIDIEGAEANVLQCWPWDKVDVDYVLIETNKGPLRSIDMFFSNHGFANIGTFLNYSRKRKTHVPLDNLYKRIRRTPLLVPLGSPTCSRADMAINPWCGPYSSWIDSELSWTRCDTSTKVPI